MFCFVMFEAILSCKASSTFRNLTHSLADSLSNLCLHMNPATDFGALEAARRLFSMAKVDFVDMMDRLDMVDNMEMVDMVDSIDMMNMQKTFGYLSLLVVLVTCNC